MPTYEYRCTNGHQYETREGFDAPARQECPSCGAQAKRVLFPPPIVFKGRGFYATDSKHGRSTTVGSDAAAFSPSSGSSDGNNGHGNGGESASKPAAAASSSDSSE